MRRRRDGIGGRAGLREARCKWFHDRRLRPADQVRKWEDDHPFPGGYGDVTLQMLCEQAACDCQWCTVDDEVDPRGEWLQAARRA